MPNRIEARSAKAALTTATGRLPLLRLFSTPLVVPPKRLLLSARCGLDDLAQRSPASGTLVVADQDEHGPPLK
jgi:hypothetical protein